MDTNEPLDQTIGLAYCPLLAYDNRGRGYENLEPQSTCDTVDCDICGQLLDLIGDHSTGHLWVCWECAETVQGTLTGFYIDGFCDNCGGVCKAQELGGERPERSLVQLLDLTGTIDTEVRRRWDAAIAGQRY